MLLLLKPSRTFLNKFLLMETEDKSSARIGKFITEIKEAVSLPGKYL